MTINIPGSDLQVSQLSDGTLSIIGADITLNQSDIPYQIPASGPLPPSQTDVVVYGTNVTIDGDLINPGRNITIIARKVSASSGTFINVSASDQPNQYSEPAEQTDRSDGAPGAGGAAGAQGGNGGSINIAADELELTPAGAGTACTPQRALCLEQAFRQAAMEALASYSATPGLNSVAVADFSFDATTASPEYPTVGIGGMSVTGLQNVAGVEVSYSATAPQLTAVVTLGPATVNAGSVTVSGLLGAINGALEFTFAPTLQLTFSLGDDLSLSAGQCTLSTVSATFAALYFGISDQAGDLGSIDIGALNQALLPSLTAWLQQHLSASLATATQALVAAVPAAFLSPQTGTGAGLVLMACGGAGGKAQDGHAGMAGGPGAPGQQVGLSDMFPVPPAACGGAGGAGGQGGNAGISGPGGDGGTVSVSLVNLPADGVVVRVTGGQGGAAATAGAPGPGGPGGPAGSYEVSVPSTNFPPPPPATLPGVAGIQGPWGAAATSQGAMGSAGKVGTGTLNGTALPASGPAPNIGTYTDSELALLLTLPQLEFTRQAAEVAYLNAQSATDYTTVAKLYTWLMKVTAPFTDSGTSFPGITPTDAATRAAINAGATVELQRLAASLDYFGNPFNWVPVLTWNALDGRVTQLLALGQVIKTQLDAAIANQDQQASAATAAEQQLNNDIANLNQTIAALDKQIQEMDKQIDGFGVQIDAQKQCIQNALTAAQKAYTQKSTGCHASDVLGALGSILGIGGSVLGGMAAIESGNAAGAANAGAGVINGVKNLVVQFQPVKSGPSFQDLSAAWQALQTTLNKYGSNSALIAINVEDFDNLLEKYMSGLPQSETDQIEGDINDLVNLIQLRNQAQVNYTAHYSKLTRMQARLTRKQAELENIAALLAAGQNPELPVYLAFLRGALTDISQEVIADLYEENQALQYWAVESSPFSLNGCDLASLTAAAASVEQSVQAYLEGTARPFTGFQGVSVVVDATSAPSAFARLQAGNPLVIQLDQANTGEAFVNAYSVTAESIGVALPGITPPAGSAAEPTLLQVLITQNGPDTRESTGKETMVFTHAPRAIIYEYNFTTNTATIEGTIGDSGQGFTGLSPFASWTLDFSSSVNSWLELSQVDSVELSFAGTLLGPDSAQMKEMEKEGRLTA